MKDKKEFRIQINGVTESIDAVKSLNAELDALSSKLKNLQNTNVKIKVQSDTSTKTKVSGNETSSEKKQLDELGKLAKQIAAQRAKSEALVTDEYKQQLQTLNQIKAANKENEQTQKQIADGIKDQNGEFSNTLAGQRAYLSELQKAFNTTEMGTDEWRRLKEELTRVREEVKNIEQSTGDFRRNVGNYPSGAKELADLFRETNEQITEATEKLDRLNRSMDSLSGQELADAQDEAARLAEEIERAKEAQEGLNDELSKKIAVGVGDTIQYFDDTDQAAEKLQKQLRALALEGKQGSKEWDATIKAYGSVRKAIVSTDKAVESFMATSSGLKTVINVMQGFSGFASLGMGISGLFGGQNKEIDDALKKFTSISLVLQGIQAIQMSMRNPQDVFGQGLKKVYDTVKGIFQWMGKISGLGKVFDKMGSSLKSFGDNIKTVSDFSSLSKNASKASDEVIKQANSLTDKAVTIKSIIVATLSEISVSLAQNTSKGVQDIGNVLDRALDGLTEYQQQLMQLQNEYMSMVQSGASADELSKKQQQIDFMADAIKDLSDMINTIGDAQLQIETGDAESAVDTITEKLNEMAESLLEDAEGSDEATKSFAKNTAEMGKMAGQTSKAVTQMNGFSKVLLKMGPVGSVVAKGISLIGSAVKGVTSAMAGMLASMAIMYAVQKAIELIAKGVKAVYNWITDADVVEAVDNLDLIDQRVERLTKKYEDLNKAIGQKASLGILNPLQQLNAELETAKKGMDEATEDFTKLLDSMISAKKISDDIAGTVRGGSVLQIWYSGDIEQYYDNIRKAQQKFMEDYQKTEAASLAGNKDAKVRLKQLTADYFNFTTEVSRTLKGLGQTNEQVWSAIDARMLKSVIANLGELFDAEKFAKTLGTSYELIIKFLDDIETKQNQIAVETQKRISDATSAAKVAAIKDPTQRTLASLKAQFEQDIKDITDPEYVKARTAQYYREVADVQKEAAKKRQQARFSDQQKEIEMLEDGLEKELKLNDLARQQTVANAKESGESVATINEYYADKANDIREKYKRMIEEFNRNLEQSWQQQEKSFADHLLDMEEKINQTTRNIKQSAAELGKEGLELDFNFDTSKTQLENYIDYYEQLYTKADELRRTLTANQRDEEAKSYEKSKADEDKRYNEAMKSYSDWLYNQQKSLRDAREQGLLTEDEYNSKLQTAQDKMQAWQRDELVAHDGEVERIETEHLQNLEKYNSQQRKDEVEGAREHYQNLETLFSDYVAAIQSKADELTEDNISGLGIINYSKQKKNLQNTLNEYTQTADKIRQAMASLEGQYSLGLISDKDYAETRLKLQTILDEITKSMKKTKKSMADLLADSIKSALDAVNEYMDQINTVWDGLSSIFDQMMDNEEARLEKKQELLEKELDMLEEQYQKQEEITQKHADNINSIEDELKDARGDRRQHLIDQLTREREEQLRSLETEEEIDKQKEQNEKKQEQLKKQQDKIEKKRKQKDRIDSIIQATISTATGVANALAVKPTPLGIVLASLVGALGAVQIATISAAKYADGGLLTGKSHSQGGIKIPGTGIEVEGNEYVVNKESTRYNQPLIEYINSNRRPLTKDDLMNFMGNKTISSMKSKYADGGQLPTLDYIDVRDAVNYRQTDNSTYVVSVVDIIDKTANVKEVQTLAGL